MYIVYTYINIIYVILCYYYYIYTLLLVFIVYICEYILYTSAYTYIYMIYMHMTGYGKYCMDASYVVIKVNIIVNSIYTLF